MNSFLLLAALLTPASAGLWQDTLAANALRADCRSAEPDADPMPVSAGCFFVIDSAQANRGGPRAYAALSGENPSAPDAVTLYAETPVLPLGRGALSGSEFAGVETLRFELDGAGRLLKAEAETPRLCESEPCGARTERFLVEGGRRVVVGYERRELKGGEATARMAAAMNAWRAKLSETHAKVGGKTVRVSSELWDPAFPLAKAAVDAAGRAVGTKGFSGYTCEYNPGAAAARCDFAYDVWPEMCWYGNDHVVADLPAKGGAATVIKREWRAD